MARSDQIKALLRAHASEDSPQFYAVATQVAADEARRGHTRLAAELRELIDAAKVKANSPRTVRPTPLAQPKGELVDLLSVKYPSDRLSQMVLTDDVRTKLDRILREQREVERLKAYDLAPRRKILLVGRPGTGKTMTAGALAGELRLPLFTVRFDSLITKFMGESSSKLRLVFDALKQTRGVYFFDEFDSLGLQRGSQHDVAEMRRTLNMFLQLLDQDDSDSLILAATNHAKDLDIALFRRFDDVVRYAVPNAEQIERLLRNRLASYVAMSFNFERVTSAAEGQSQAEISRACIDTIKDTILNGEGVVSEDSVIAHLSERAHNQFHDF
ncbi:TPA: ATP-binding protein [Burkholderia cepacia ATCC 25416]|uniref:AAA family ATPase n=1 Tax=Burkholderia cepacia TaxID=292 RepID=UPI00075C0819|nr:ATP-binding protein [Burkholderia cepacia]HDR9269296.1 ATP-binding protein [Burkholderia vietnamiensis]HDR9764955.1 ATP-binding protein [Burkholderia cepacia ATCC 25416]KVA30103.1 ATPase [Burkholderia cepacia]KVA37418.1 ATPase [Burkholderia cepacia]HDR9774962.1 ATP-binding protein [Burkholderia cepacia ATCC 25416]